MYRNARKNYYVNITKHHKANLDFFKKLKWIIILIFTVVFELFFS